MKKKVSIIITLLVAFTIGGCNYTHQKNEQKSAKKKEVIKIGAILPLTGAGASFANYIKDGLSFSAEHFNKNNRFFELKIFYEDSKTSVKEGVIAYKKLISRNRVDVIVVALSSVAEAIKQNAVNDSVPQIGIAVATPNYTEFSDFIFRIYPNANTMAGIMADYNLNVLNKTRHAVVYINDDFGRASLKAYEKNVNKNNARVVSSESYEILQKDFRNLVLKTLARNSECIYLNGYGMGYSTFIKQLFGYNNKVILKGDMTMGLPITLKQIKEINDTIYFVDGKMEPKFITDFNNEFHYNPTSYSGYAYDFISIIGKVVQNLNSTNGINLSIFIDKSLYSIKNFNGVMGSINIEKSGDCNLQFQIKKISYGKVVENRDN